jgi:hypothetical protein
MVAEAQNMRRKFSEIVPLERPVEISLEMPPVQHNVSIVNVSAPGPRRFANDILNLPQLDGFATATQPFKPNHWVSLFFKRRFPFVRSGESQVAFNANEPTRRELNPY